MDDGGAIAALIAAGALVGAGVASVWNSAPRTTASAATPRSSYRAQASPPMPSGAASGAAYGANSATEVAYNANAMYENGLRVADSVRTHINRERSLLDPFEGAPYDEDVRRALPLAHAVLACKAVMPRSIDQLDADPRALYELLVGDLDDGVLTFAGAPVDPKLARDVRTRLLGFRREYLTFLQSAMYAATITHLVFEHVLEETV